MTETDSAAPLAAFPVFRAQPTWRINHPAEAGGPSYVLVEPSQSARAAFLRIGVTITEMHDGPGPEAGTKRVGSGWRAGGELAYVFQEKLRVAGVMLSTLGRLEHFEHEPHWRREIANLATLISDMQKHLTSG